jgi:hypothetical protein
LSLKACRHHLPFVARCDLELAASLFFAAAAVCFDSRLCLGPSLFVQAIGLCPPWPIHIDSYSPCSICICSKVREWAECRAAYTQAVGQ